MIVLFLLFWGPSIPLHSDCTNFVGAETLLETWTSRKTLSTMGICLTLFSYEFLDSSYQGLEPLQSSSSNPGQYVYYLTLSWVRLLLGPFAYGAGSHSSHKGTLPWIDAELWLSGEQECATSTSSVPDRRPIYQYFNWVVFLFSCESLLYILNTGLLLD